MTSLVDKKNSFQLWAVVPPEVGLLSVLAGFAFAMVSLPADLNAQDALRVPALFLIVSLCLVPGLAALRDPKSIFRAEHVLVMAPVYWLLLDPLQGRFDMAGVAREDVQRSFTAIALFVAGAWIAFVQRPWRAPEFIRSTTRSELPSRFYFGIGILAFVLAFLKYAIPSGFEIVAMAQALGDGRWAGAWNRGSLGGTDAFLDHLSYFGYLLPPLTVVLARRLGWADRRPLLLGIGALVISTFLIQSGGRRLVGMFFGSGGVVWFLGKPKVRFTTVLGLAVLVLGLLFMLEQILMYRNVGALAMFDPDLKRELEQNDTGVLVHVDDNFLRLTQTTAIFPDLHPHTTWRYVLWVAARPVPRLFWPGKPLDPGFDLPEFVGVKGTTLSSSVIGELFMAGGFVAVAIGGWFYGRLAQSLSHFLSGTPTSGGLLIYSVGLFALLVGVRSMIELVLASYVIGAWVVLVRLSSQPDSSPVFRASNESVPLES